MSRTLPIAPPTPAAPPPAPLDEAADRSALERMFPVVFRDPAIRDRLLAASDPAELGALVSEVAAAHGIEMPAERVDALLGGARRRWLERRL